MQCIDGVLQMSVHNVYIHALCGIVFIQWTACIVLCHKDGLPTLCHNELHMHHLCNIVRTHQARSEHITVRDYVHARLIEGC